MLAGRRGPRDALAEAHGVSHRALLPVDGVPMLLRVLRTFRILRILRLLKGAKGLRDLLMTMVLSFPALVNVASLLMLTVFVYAVLGVQLFTYVKWQNKP